MPQPQTSGASPVPDSMLNSSSDPTPIRRLSPRESHHRRRGWITLGILVALLLLAVLPPFLSLSRFQRRIATSMSQVLGRPVHLDHVELNLLPFPSFTLTNLVIDELPPFGAEPILRANTVSARIRLSSLWRRRIEFSRITFSDPSVNLVRNPDGRWNLESVLLQASRLDTAPTAQPGRSSVPRFPYIEATGARVNLKLAQHKTPFSITEAEFALWLPEPREWRIRLRAHPARTDSSASDTGLLRAEATLDRAPTMAQVPLTLDATWTGAPLGEASRLLTGNDAGLRGEVSLTSHLAGTLDDAALDLRLQLSGLHRVDLVPDRPVDVDMRCRAQASHLLHALSGIHCLWPVDSSVAAQLLAPDSAAARFLPGASQTPSRLILTGSVPDLLTPSSADLTLAAEHIPADTLLRWARATTGRLAPDLRATGMLSGIAVWPGSSIAPRPSTSLKTPPPGSLIEAGTVDLPRSDTPTTPAAQFMLTGLALSGGRLGPTPVRFGTIVLIGSAPHPRSLTGASLRLAPIALAFGRSTSSHEPAATGEAPDASVTPAPDSGDAAPESEAPGSNADAETGAVPASAAAPLAGATATLDGTATLAGYTAHLAGLVPLPRLLALGADVPAFGAGLAYVLPTNRASGPTRIDLTMRRLWGANPVWIDASTAPPTPVSTNHPLRRANR